MHELRRVMHELCVVMHYQDDGYDEGPSSKLQLPPTKQARNLQAPIKQLLQFVISDKAQSSLLQFSARASSPS